MCPKKDRINQRIIAIKARLLIRRRGAQPRLPALIAVIADDALGYRMNWGWFLVLRVAANRLTCCY